MTSYTSWQQNLLEVLNSHGTRLSKSDIAELHALGDDTSLARWSRKTVKSQNVLSAEEFKIWQHIKKTRVKHAAVKAVNSESDVPIDEAELRKAVESLEISTRSIRRYQEILNTQQEYSSAFRRKYGPDDIDPSVYRTNLRRKHQAEAQQLKFMLSELRGEVEFKLSLMQGNCEKAVKAIPHIATERLNADDRILEVLDSLSSNDAQVDHTQVIAAKQRRVTHLTTLLQQATAEALKTRLDRIYLEELQHQFDSHLIDDEERSEAEALKADLETLYTEIDDVAAMVIQHEYGKPLDTILTATERAQQKQRRVQQEKICETLDNMTKSMEDLAQRCEQIHSYRVTLDQIQDHMTQVQQLGDTSQKRRESVSRKRTSFGRAPATSTDTQPALKALMQHLNIDATKAMTAAAATTFKVTPVSNQQHHRSKSNPGLSFTNPASLLTNNISALQLENQSLATKIVEMTNEAIFQRKQHSQFFSNSDSATNNTIRNSFDEDNGSNNHIDPHDDHEDTFANQTSQLKQLDILTTQAKAEIEDMASQYDRDGVKIQMEFVREWQRRKQMKINR